MNRKFFLLGINSDYVFVICFNKISVSYHFYKLDTRTLL